ncbi:hypothetical protein SAMN05443245_5185 [Paraburkholderia fungorum]|uniref:DUF1566 domain-containing protein n=1 Tax=Paraburkholderia fungorum TaxID=134537 RepID=A0A1H1IHS5_9BURK|nr:DUF1566 domain-containing protein [Paraburkholderia fungorum]SDR37109.1 hypothetical protein SAMN05443245_5185 [Paraburkholderia fungorum]
MTVTLEAIKAEQMKVSKMIAEFERQAATSIIQIEAAEISLAPGEKYAGVIIGEDGSPGHHVILLPGEAETVDWADAGKWAAEQGGELPNRREQSLLFANLKGEFQSAWYWSGQQHETNSGWAWYQDFNYGHQSHGDKDFHCRARVVRRLVIE